MHGEKTGPLHGVREDATGRRKEPDRDLKDTAEYLPQEQKYDDQKDREKIIVEETSIILDVHRHLFKTQFSKA